MEITIKPPRPSDCRRALKLMWSKVAVYSCADGTIKLEPVWKGRIAPGLFDRMHAANMVAHVLSLPVHRINWKKRI